MKKLLLLLITLSTLSFSQTNWIWQNPLPVGKSLNAGQAFDSLVCYAAGNAGAFLRTTDGGSNWQLINTGTDYDILSISFKDRLNGVLGCGQGLIMKTTDGGNSFTKVMVDSVRDIKAVQFLPSGKVWAAGDKGLFLTSQDNGSSWARKTFDTVSIATIFFFESGKGFIAGESGTIFRTLDGGNNWSKIREDLNQTISSISFSSELNGLALGRNGLSLKTTDGGASWQQFNSGLFGWIKSFSQLPGNNLIAAGSPGLIFRSSDNGNSWRKTNDSSKFYFNFSTFTGNVGWLFGNNGLIMHSTDGGENWEFQSEGSENTINSIEFLDAMIGTAVGDSGLILRTEDGGDTWVRQFTQYTTNLNDLFFLDTIRGWIVGDDGTILQTLDAGQSWQKHDLANITSDDIYAIEGTKFSNKAAGQNGAYLVSQNSPSGAVWGRGGAPLKTYRGIITLSSRSATLVGDQGAIIRFVTVPGGGGVVDQSIDSRFDLRDIYFTPAGKGWIVGKYGIVLRSSNSGGSWSIIDTLPVTWLNSVYFYDTLNGYTVGSFGSLYKTGNGGYDWNKVYTGVTNTFKKSFFFDKDNGWIVGTYGLLMKTTNGGGSGTPTGIDEEIVTPKSPILHQNYPNPFNPSTAITFDVPSAGHYKLAIYDILGKEIDVPLDGVVQPGSHFVFFNGASLSSGIYFYRLTGNGIQISRKMILIK